MVTKIHIYENKNENTRQDSIHQYVTPTAPLVLKFLCMPGFFPFVRDHKNKNNGIVVLFF